MLAEQEAWDAFQTLPPHEKREVVDFIARLQARHAEQAAQANSEAPNRLVSPLGAMKGLIIKMADDFDAPLDPGFC